MPLSLPTYCGRCNREVKITEIGLNRIHNICGYEVIDVGEFDLTRIDVDIPVECRAELKMLRDRCKEQQDIMMKFDSVIYGY